MLERVFFRRASLAEEQTEVWTLNAGASFI
jgi:hypothetical protein